MLLIVTSAKDGALTGGPAFLKVCVLCVLRVCAACAVCVMRAKHGALTGGPRIPERPCVYVRCVCVHVRGRGRSHTHARSPARPRSAAHDPLQAVGDGVIDRVVADTR